MAARLYSPAPPMPGVHIVEVNGERVVPVFTSEMELARFMGRARWFSTTGLDLMDMLPAGVTLGLDMASPHRLQLDPAAVRLSPAIYVSARRGQAAGRDSAGGPNADGRAD